MSYWKLLPTALLVLALAACGAEQETDGMDAGQEQETTEAEPTGRDTREDTTLADPEEAWEEPSETSRELWALIQEDQSELTGEQQRALQACAEIRLRDHDIEMEDAVQECRDEMEEMAEEQEEGEDEEEGGEEG